MMWVYKKEGKHMKKLIVFSADAFVWEDVAYLRTLPNYKKYLDGGCNVERIESVYPTNTYPCHATMSSGVYPDKHRVTGNFHLAPGRRPAAWMWEYSNVKWKEDIFWAAKNAGYSTAAVFWPMTGNHPYIDYLIDEYWPQSPEEEAEYLECYRKLGSSDEMLKIIEKNMDLEAIKGHPFRDHFAVLCASDVIRRYKPDVLFVHPANIDGARHGSGVFSDKVRASIEETDQWLGELMQAVEEIGELENTNLVLISDHGQMESKRVINPNVLLADHGLIRVNEDGSIKEWDAWCQGGGMSGLIYLKNPEDKELHKKVWKILNDYAQEGIYGFIQVFTTEETAKKYHLDGDFSFVIESDGYTGFWEGYKRPLVTNFDVSDYRLGRATHGYLPFKGPQPTFLAKGPDFKENVVIPRGRLVDEAPTYAKLLGAELPNADGKAMEEILKI